MASKSWLETRGRFLIGLAAVCMLCIALISWQGSLRSRLELGSPQLDAVSAASRMAYATYVHRFLDFSTDFAVWVVFWGPAGGEQA